MHLVLELAGQRWKFFVPDEELHEVHLPVLREISHKASQKQDALIVFLAGPPGAGKTTIAALWEQLSHDSEDLADVQVLPMDGFHLKNKELEEKGTVFYGEKVPLKSIKGAAESFDLENLSSKLKVVNSGQNVYWPFYDRRIHDSIDNAIKLIETGVIIIEGNYLLFDEKGWRDLSQHADMKIFIECDERTLKSRLIQRQVRGGKTREQAFDHFYLTDKRNIELVLSKRLPADVLIKVYPDGSKRLVLRR